MVFVEVILLVSWSLSKLRKCVKSLHFNDFLVLSVMLSGLVCAHMERTECPFSWLFVFVKQGLMGFVVNVTRVIVWNSAVENFMIFQSYETLA